MNFALPSPLHGHAKAVFGAAEWLGLGMVFFVGWSLRAVIPLTPLSDGDTWGFLMPAISFLAGEGIVDVQQREWIYSAFLAAALKATGSFDGLVMVQQTIGLLGGLLLWLVWKSWVGLLPESNALRITAIPAGLLCVAVYLWNPHLILFERSLRPEVLMIPAALAQLLCALLFIRFRWVRPSPLGAILTGAGAVLFAFVVFKLKPSWALAVPATTLPVFLGVFGKGLPLGTRLAAPVAGILAVLILVWLPQKLLFVAGDEPRTILPLTLFTMNADSIRDSMQARLESGQLTEEKENLYRAILPTIGSELEAARGMLRHYPRVGFDPDYLLYQAAIFPQLVNEHGFKPADIADFCNTVYRQAWLDQPVSMSRKVIHQLGYFACPDPLTFSRKRIKLREHYAHTQQNLPENLAEGKIQWVATAYTAHRKDLAEKAQGSEAVIASVRSLHTFLDSFSRAILPLELIYLALFVVTLFLGSLRDFRLAGFGVLLLASAPAANALTVALVHALDNSRYRASYGPLLFLALMAMTLFIFGILLRGVSGVARRHTSNLKDSRR